MLGQQNEREWASFCTTVLQQPALGEHTDAILAELGYASGDIAALRAAHAI